MWPTKVATLTLPTKETHAVAVVWPSPAGTLLFLGEINLAPPARHELVATLTNTLASTWRAVGQDNLDAENSLEKILLQLNPTLLPYERSWGNPLAPRYHLILALVKENMLALSTIGHTGAFVVAPDHLTNVISITQGSIKPFPKPSFSQLIGGRLEPSETLLISTSSLFDYLSAERVRQLVGGRAPGLALRDIEKLITTIEHHPPLGLIALRLEEAGEDTGTQTSIDRFLKTKAETSSLIKPTVWSYTKSRLKGIFKRQKLENTAPEQPREEFVEETKPATPLMAMQEHRHNFFYRFKLTLSKLSWLTNRETAKATISWWLEAKLTDWRRLPMPKRILFGIAIIALLALSQNIVSYGRNNIKTKDSENYNSLVTQITEYESKIESALIYHDDTKARGLFGETKKILEKLPRNSSTRDQQYQALNNYLQLLQKRLDRRVELTNIPIFAALPQGANKEWNGIIILDKTLYAYNTKGEIINISPEGKIGANNKLPTEMGKPNNAYPLNNAILIQGEKGTQAIFDTKNNKSILLTTPINFIDASFYENKLYYLQDKPRVILRTNIKDNAFGAPTRWLRPSQGELFGAVSLAVDGGIFVAETNNVKKFVLGLKREFNLQTVTPPLAGVKFIRTTSEGDYLYLISPADKRVVIFDKQGKLITQFDLKEFSDIMSIAIDGPNKYLYILDKSNIYKIKVLDYISS